MDFVRLNPQADKRTLFLVVRGLNHPFEAFDVNDDFIVNALEGHIRHRAGQILLGGRHDVDILRANNHVDTFMRGKTFVDTGKAPAGKFAEVILVHDTVKDITLPDKIRHKSILRLIVNILRRANLLNEALVHHHNRIAHGESLLLIVRDKNEGDTGCLLNPFELHLHILAQLEIQRAKRLIEQQHLRIIGKSAGNRHTLLLAAGKAVHTPALKAGQTNHFQHFMDSLANLLFALLMNPHPKATFSYTFK